MKTVTFVISALLMFFSFSIEAQNHHEEHHGQHQRGPRERMNPEQMIQRMVAQLKSELKLDEKQEKQVSELLTANFKKRGEIFQKYRNNQDSLMFYHQKVEKEQNDYLEFMIHSSEFMLGGSPYYKNAEEIELLFHVMDEYFSYITRKRYVGSSLAEYGRKINEHI